MKLTDSNYYGLSADKAFVSSHQIGNFLECPSKEVARLMGKYVPPDRPHFAFGRYVDVALTSPLSLKKYTRRERAVIHKKPTQSAVKKWAKGRKIEWEDFTGQNMDAFLQAYPEVYMDGPKTSDYQLADKLITHAKNDTTFMAFMKGETQVILTGELDGIRIKGIPDIIKVDDEIFVDLKTTRDFDTTWDAKLRMRVPWYEVYNYWRQLALYQEMLRQRYDRKFLPVIAGLSKQDPPARGIWSFEDQDRLDRELEQIREFLPQIVRWKDAEEEAPMCGNLVRCDWCRANSETKIEIAESCR